MIIGVVMLAAGVAIKVSSFGFDPVDATEIVQKALDSGAAQVVLDRQAAPWTVRPLKLRSNTELVFEDGVELVAKRGEFKGSHDTLLDCSCVTNVILRGLGAKGGTLRMWKEDYRRPELYKKAEWRYCLRILGSENVLVENMTFTKSGGDGIVIGYQGAAGARNVTIRRCLCDDNYRQGISYCGGENILVEDTVLSNTEGTAPQAGLDIEPDLPHEGVVNAMFRNVVSRNNAGNGFELWLNKLTAASRPVSVVFENCRTEGCRCGTRLVTTDQRATDLPHGFVSYRGCTFAEASVCGVRVLGTSTASFAASFVDCVISNAAPSNPHGDVHVGTGHVFQGNPDNLAFERLTVYQAKPRNWFLACNRSLGPSPKNVRGDVTVVRPDGSRERIVLDRAWAEANIPACGDLARPDPLPRAADVVAVDTKPGECVELGGAATFMGGWMRFLVEKSGPVKFFYRQVTGVKGRPASELAMLFHHIRDDGSLDKPFPVKLPGFDGGEVVFEAKETGFYALRFPKSDTKHFLERASVPIALDLTKPLSIVSAKDNRSSFSLYAYVPGGRDVQFLADATDDYYRFSAAVYGPDGTCREEWPLVERLVVHKVPPSAPAGLYRLAFGPTKKPTYDWVYPKVTGLPPFLFLSGEKYWK